MAPEVPGSEAIQRAAFESVSDGLKKAIAALTVKNLPETILSLFRINLVRGRGLLSSLIVERSRRTELSPFARSPASWPSSTPNFQKLESSR